MSAVDDVFAYLQAQTIGGTTSDWALLRRRMLDDSTAAQALAVQEDGGPEPEMPAAEGIGDSALAEAGVLVTVRAKAWDGDASRAKAQAVIDVLHGLRGVQLAGNTSRTYLAVRALTSEPVFAGFDDQGRPKHTVALRLQYFL